MATKARIAANRRNAKKSTGPKTPEGKAKSCMNALRHGLRAQKAVLPNENQEDFNQVHAGLQDLYQPQTVVEQDLVEQAVLPSGNSCAPKLRNRLLPHTPTPTTKPILNRITQIQTRLERSYFKAYKELERIKAARPEPVVEPVAEPVAANPSDPESEPVWAARGARFSLPVGFKSRNSGLTLC